TEAGNADDGELHRQHIARLTARIIARRLVHRGHFTVGEGGGVEARRFECILVEPEADCVFRFHLGQSPCAIEAREPCFGRNWRNDAWPLGPTVWNLPR